MKGEINIIISFIVKVNVKSDIRVNKKGSDKVTVKVSSKVEGNAIMDPDHIVKPRVKCKL